MNDIQKLIIDTYTEKPRHFAQILKRNTEIIKYIKENVPISITSFLEQLYYVVYNDDGICFRGNKKKLKTFAGYSFCGKTGVCQCAKESVSNSVSESKNNYTEEQRIVINEKRKNTTLEKYGVTNTGQIQSAKNAHAEFYKDVSKVADAVSRTRKTKIELYGDGRYNNRKKAEDTCLERYGVKNTWSLSDEKQNPALDILRDKFQLEQIFPKMSVTEIANTYKLHEQTIYYYLNFHKLRVPYKSTFEQEIVHYLNTLGITNILSNKRTIIGKELDIFLPNYNLAIEYNGVFWHHDKISHITKTYHKDKFILCESKGIELFTIFSDSWESKKDIWKKKISAKLGFSEKVYGRNTEVIPLSPSQTIDILNNNHIQGYCVSEIALGLVYNNELVAAMTFSKSRTGIGKDRGSGSYELVRYVSSKTVIGGASKLLKHFIEKYSPESIVSYSDNQYSVGNLYKVLGFELENDASIGYRYYDPVKKKMYHRYNFTKHKLVKMGHDSNKTEREIMDDLGYLRIWDCGSRTWVLNI